MQSVPRVREYRRSCQSRPPKFHKVWYFSVLSRSDCPTVRLTKKSVVVRWEIVGNWLDHNWTGSWSFAAMFFSTVTSYQIPVQLMAAWPIRFSTGARPGKRPHAPDLNWEDTKRKNDRQFYEKEKCPEWKFQNKWQENQEWLQYNVNENNILALPNFDNVTTCWLMSRFP